MRREATSGTGASPKVLGVARYEFKMQIRRKALWTSLPLLGLLAFTGDSGPLGPARRRCIPNLTGTWPTPVGEYTISSFLEVGGLYVEELEA